MQLGKWQTVERAILRALSLQIRIMTADQILRAWFQNPIQAPKTVHRLESAGLIEKQLTEAHPLITLRKGGVEHFGLMSNRKLTVGVSINWEGLTNQMTRPNINLATFANGTLFPTQQPNESSDSLGKDRD